MHNYSVYLAGPIDYVADDGIFWWREEAASLLGNASCFNPHTAFINGIQDNRRYVESVNMHALRQSTGVLAFVDGKTSSWGTPIEIAEAQNRKIPIVIYCPTEDLPLYFRHLHVEPTLRDACIRLIELMEHKSENHLSRIDLLRSYGGGLHTPQYAGDIGYDLETLNPHTLAPNPRVPIIKIGLGRSDNLRVRLPDGMWCEIRVRSGWAAKVTVVSTVIDSGYIGPLYAFVRNVSGRTLMIEAGTRMAQLVLHQGVVCMAESVDAPESLGVTERGERAFGSSDKET